MPPRPYLPDGRAPKVGELFRNRDLAGSLEAIAANGWDGFFKGKTANAMIDTAAENGVQWLPADLADFQPECLEPISDNVPRLDGDSIASQRARLGSSDHAE
jgi:gamma-glutamyltranspeptidase/glutathione hydrolase